MRSILTVLLLGSLAGWAQPAMAQSLNCHIPGGWRVSPDPRTRAWIGSATMRINPDNLASPDWRTWGTGNISAVYASTAVARETPGLIEISSEPGKKSYLNGINQFYSVFRLTIDRGSLDAKITEQLVPVGVSFTWQGRCVAEP